MCSLRDDQGHIIVPTLALMSVALVLGLAVLALVDTQTREARAQRSSDAAQVLAEGVAAATANALATDSAASDWAATGPCRQFTGDLQTPSSAGAATLDARITAAVQERFAGTSDDYDGALYASSWKVDICPPRWTQATASSWHQDDDERWSDTYLTETVNQPVGRGPEQLSVWVRSQSAVRRVGTAERPRRKAVATKVRQSSVAFAPPSDFAVGTGSFSTELTTTVSGLTSGPLLGSILRTKPLIADNAAKVGVRCGLLGLLDDPSSVCLSGTFSGVTGATNELGLETLTDALGVGRTETLPTWTMAPADVQDAYKRSATLLKESGTVPGTGNVVAKNASGAPECYTEPTDANTIVYIEQVGDGNQYCTITGTPGRDVARILVVGRGGVRITGPFTGVVYALNRQECGDDGECDQGDRADAPLREVVRIEGNAGKVTGAVWADGAGGTVGIYPSLTGSSAAGQTLLANVCALPLVGPLLNVLGSTLDGVGQLVGNILGSLGGTQTQVRYPGGGQASTGCAALTAHLGTLTSSQLLNLFATGGNVDVPVSEKRTRSCTLFVCGSWSSWSVRDTQTVQLPALTSDLIGALTSVLTNYTAVQYDEDVVASAGTSLSVGSGPVVGTYRNVTPN